MTQSTDVVRMWTHKNGEVSRPESWLVHRSCANQYRDGDWLGYDRFSCVEPVQVDDVYETACGICGGKIEEPEPIHAPSE